MSKPIKRIQKSKKEILSEIQLNQNANRMRDIIKNKVYPFLVENKESIAYYKVFLQALSGLVNGVYEEKAKLTTIKDLIEPIDTKLNTIFKVSDTAQKREYDRYIAFLNTISDVSIYDLGFITELPRYIDGYLLKDKGQEKMDIIDIDKLLG